jgi:hypothetical protein
VKRQTWSIRSIGFTPLNNFEVFFRPHRNPSKTIHAIYLISTSGLGILLSLLVHVVIESQYLRWAMDQHKVIHWYAGCALHPILQIGLLIVGVVGGYFLGKFWWRLVYIERRWTGWIRK